jgi:hypothetical protein
MVWMAHFPKYAALPVSFQCRTAFSWFTIDVARRVIGRFPVIEKRTAIGEISVHPWRIRHLPRVNDLSVEVDQVNRAVAAQWGEQRKSSKGSVTIVCTYPNARPLYLVLLNGWDLLPPICASYF